MDYLEILTITILSYFIGSVPTSIWLSKFYYGIDIRDHGSGTASHLNVRRVLGKRSAYIVRFVDICKGFLAANLAYHFHRQYGIFSDFELPILMMCFGLSAIIGHIFPAFAGFRGGKGVHVSVGVLIAINPLVSLIFIGISFIIVLISRFPNLGYAVGACSLPFVIYSFRGHLEEFYYVPTLVFGLFLAFLLLFTHRNNLIKIFRNGDDYKISNVLV